MTQLVRRIITGATDVSWRLWSRSKMKNQTYKAGLSKPD
jgi:hypothetical protein